MTNNDLSQQERIGELRELFNAVTFRQGASEKIRELENSVIANVSPDDVVILVHQLVEENFPMEELKSGISKFLNVLYKSLMAYPYLNPLEDSFLNVCIQNNAEAERRLDKIRPYMHRIREKGLLEEYKVKLIELWTDVKLLTNYYLIKENIIFPLIEKRLEDYRCIAVMWSIHDDIRHSINRLIDLLSGADSKEEDINRITGNLFFDIKAIIFREERLLYPFMQKMIPEEEIEAIYNESIESGFPYITAERRVAESAQTDLPTDFIDLKNGQLTAEQIILVFNHLPVDITYVDENDRVRFFSTPQHRIFHRSNAVVGRDVHNCHPQESVHVVEKIVESFRNGARDSASFWFGMRDGKRVLIQYFAVRDHQGKYRGVIEVSQIINEIQELKGEKKILDWET